MLVVASSKFIYFSLFEFISFSTCIETNFKSVMANREKSILQHAPASDILRYASVSNYK